MKLQQVHRVQVAFVGLVVMFLAVGSVRADDSSAQALEFMRQTAESAARAADAAQRAAQAAEKIAQASSQPTETAAPTVVAPAKKDVIVTGIASASLVWLAGNAKALTGTANMGLNLNIQKWTVGFKGMGVYGQSRAPGETQDRVTALAANGEVRGAREITHYAGIYTSAGGGIDHVASIDWRAFGDFGAVFTLVNRQEGDFVRLRVTADIGPRYQHEAWFRFFATADGPVGKLPSQNILFVRAAGALRYALDKRTVLSQTVELLPDVLNANNFNMGAVSALAVKLIGPLSLGVTFTLRFDNQPPPGAEKLDTALALGAEVAF